jgi:hypothetical protein
MDVLLFTSSSVIGELLLLLLVVAVLWEFALEGSARSKAISPHRVLGVARELPIQLPVLRYLLALLREEFLPHAEPAKLSHLH